MIRKQKKYSKNMPTSISPPHKKSDRQRRSSVLFSPLFPVTGGCDQKNYYLAGKTPRPTNHSNCHPDRSEAKWRDLALYNTITHHTTENKKAIAYLSSVVLTKEEGGNLDTAISMSLNDTENKKNRITCTCRYPWFYQFYL